MSAVLIERSSVCCPVRYVAVGRLEVGQFDELGREAVKSFMYVPLHALVLLSLSTTMIMMMWNND